MKAALLLTAALALTGCGEAEQVVVYKQGKYQGKPDTPAWGERDREVWEKDLRNRQLTQDENRRIYQ